MPRETQLPERVTVGEILRPHGVRGELRMRVLTATPEHLPQLEYIYLADSTRQGRLEKRALEGLRFNKAYALLRLEGCVDRDEADKLRGHVVLIDREQAPPLAEGEYYLFQLIGLSVVADGIAVGRICEVLETGANDVYVVNGEEYGEILIPAHEETIDAVDFEAGVVTMTLPEGLLSAPG